jgi:hypothetical protein
MDIRTERIGVLIKQLAHAQADYEWARARGDAERAVRIRLKISAITAERDRLTKPGASSSHADLVSARC